MNKIFKVVWSKTRNAYVVVSETAKANGKSSVKAIAATLAVAFMLSGGMMSAEAAEQTINLNGENIVFDHVDNKYLASGYDGNQPNPIKLNGTGVETVTFEGAVTQCALAVYGSGKIEVNNVGAVVVTDEWRSPDDSIGNSGNVFYANGGNTKTAELTFNMPNGTIGNEGTLKNAMLFHATDGGKIVVNAGEIDLKTTSNSIVAQRSTDEATSVVSLNANNVSLESDGNAVTSFNGKNNVNINAKNGNASVVSNNSNAISNSSSGDVTVTATGNINMEAGLNGINVTGSRNSVNVLADGNVSITADDNAVFFSRDTTGGAIKITGNDINIESTGEAGGDGWHGNAIMVGGTSAGVKAERTLDIQASNDLTITGAKNAIYLRDDDKYVVANISAANDLNINGSSKLYNGKDYNISGKNIYVNAQSDKALEMYTAQVDIVAEESINIENQGKYGIVVNSNYGEGTKVDAEKISIKADSAAVLVQDKTSKIALTAKEFDIKGNIYAQGNGNITIDSGKHSDGYKADITGDIISKDTSTVDVALGNNGTLTGKVTTAAAATTQLDLGNDSTWNVTANSTVTSLKGTDANLVQGATDEVVVSVVKPGTGSAMTGATMNVGEGVTLAVSSDDRTGSGIVKDVNISGEGNLEITSDKAWFGLGYGQNQIDVDQLKIEVTDGGAWGAIYSDNLSTGNHVVKANDAQLFSGNDVVHNQGSHNIVVDVENELELIGEDGYGVLNISKEAGEINLYAETVKITSNDRSAVKVGDSIGKTGYNGTVNIGDDKTKNITIKGAAQNPASGNERKSAAIYTQGGGSLNLNATENITIENTNETNNVTAKGAAIGAYDGGTISVDGNEGTVDVKGQVVAATNTTVTLKGETVNVTSQEDSLDTWGGTITVDADNINITSTEKDGIQANDATVTLNGENVTVDGGAWGIKNIAETTSNIEVKGTDVTIKGEEGAIWAVDAGGVGEVNVNADNIDIQGEVLVELDSAVTLKGETVSVAGGTEDALDSWGGTIDIDATDSINITSDTNDGIQANDATITLDAEKVTIESGQWAIKNLDETDSDVTINATDVTIKGVAGAIMTSENGQGSVTVNGEGKTTIEGNIAAASNGNVSVLLNTADSSLTGAVTTENGATTTLTMNNGAVWNVTAESNVTNLAGTQGTIAVEEAEAGFVTIQNNQNENLTLDVANGGDLGVDVKAGLQELKNTVVDGEGNALIKEVDVDTVSLSAAVDEDANGKVTTTIKPGDEFVIESDVTATGDVVAGDVSLQDTAAQVDTNTKDIASNKEAIDKNAKDIASNKEAIDKNAKDIATVNTNLVNAVNTINQNVADGFNTINQNVADGFNTINGAIATEAADRQAADKALQAQVDTNKAGIATNAAGIQQNANAIAGLNQNVSRLDGRLDKVGAGAAALAALHPLDYDSENKLSFSAGVGNYAGQTAAAVGAFYRPNEDVMFSIGGTAGNGENMVNAGVSFAIGKGSSGVAKMSKAELVQEVTNMKAENEELKQENKDIRHELNKLRELVMKLAEK